MDGALAVGGCCARGGDCACHRGPRQSRPTRVDHRGSHLDDQHWNDRKRPINLNRGALYLALWSGDYFLAELFGEISMAHLGFVMRFSRPWTFGEMFYSPRIFLCDRAC